MDRATKEEALRLLGKKAGGAGITYPETGLETGYGRRRPIGLSHGLEGSGEAAALVHGNSGPRPRNAARPGEVACLRKLEGLYPNVVSAHSRGICIGGVSENPAKADGVGRYGPCMRGPTWFGDSSRGVSL